MLQIRLSKGASADNASTAGCGGGGGAASGAGAPSVKAAAVGPGAAEGVMVACPDHLVIADLPVAKSIGAVTASAASAARTIGRRSRRPLGERVHICSRCDFPVAIYGRLTPCEHAFCLTCARSDSSCYLVSSPAYPNLFGTKGFVDVVIVMSLHQIVGSPTTLDLTIASNQGQSIQDAL